MNATRFATVSFLGALLSTIGYVASNAVEPMKNVPADRALTGVPLAMTPDQLPEQFRAQLRGDVKNSKGVAVLKRSGKDIEYAFNWDGMTSSVSQGISTRLRMGKWA